MTTLDLDAIKARCAAATVGPWNGYVMDADAKVFAGPVGQEGYLTGQVFAFVESLHEDDHDCDRPIAADLDFIIHAREDVPALVFEVEQLRREKQQLQYLHMIELTRLHIAVGELRDELDALTGREVVPV